jgi:hypothetical protein
MELTCADANEQTNDRYETDLLVLFKFVNHKMKLEIKKRNVIAYLLAN